jgi:hypothetical protein
MKKKVIISGIVLLTAFIVLNAVMYQNGYQWETAALNTQSNVVDGVTYNYAVISAGVEKIYVTGINDIKYFNESGSTFVTIKTQFNGTYKTDVKNVILTQFSTQERSAFDRD